jgi:hypothetical protein
MDKLGMVYTELMCEYGLHLWQHGSATANRKNRKQGKGPGQVNQ